MSADGFSSATSLSSDYPGPLGEQVATKPLFAVHSSRLTCYSFKFAVNSLFDVVVAIQMRVEDGIYPSLHRPLVGVTFD
jgi:hypothetical protein